MTTGFSDVFQGSMVALATPMHQDGAVDYEALAGLVEFHVENGTDALVPAGTTGESATLDFDEHCRVIRRVVEFANGRLPVIAGTGANSTREALELTQDAKDAGADACLLVTPYYNKPTQEGLFAHYAHIAGEVAIPQILYNVPGRTACDMQVETVARLSRVENIVGIKEASSFERCQSLLESCGGGFMVLSGEDALAREVVLAGGKGVISVVANVAPRLMHEMCAAALVGDAARAGKLDEALGGLHVAMFVESNPIPVKWALQQMGFVGPGIRLPLLPLSEPHRDAVREAMRRAGVADA